jgi:tetratricopeptide (TPR) repeat protein
VISEMEEDKEPRIEVYPKEREATEAPIGAMPRPEVKAAVSGKIKVGVNHGNLAFARHTVIAGHYEGDTIRGAEASLDRHLDGRLNRKRKLGLYPGKLDTAEFIRDDNGKPPGALIIGLGGFGDLSPGGLRRTYAHALKKFADISTDGKPDAASLCISTLLIGHRESRLTLRDSLSAMMEGLIDASAELKGIADFTEVEIIELYEDTAISALRILRALSKETRISDKLDIKNSLGTLGGKLKRISPSDEAEWARKIQIRRKDESGYNGSLTFTALTGSAHATEVALATQGALIDPYLQSLTADTAIKREVSETLFELLTPKEFKSLAAEDRDVVLILDEAAAAYPWELLDDRFGSGDKPMVVRSSCIRHLIDAQPEFRSGLSTEKRAVVIGDSANDPSGDFQELLGAQQEAEAVASLLESSSEGIEVNKVIKGTCAEIANALLRTGARIMHIAAHGVYEFERDTSDGQKEKVTGMVLGDGAFFTAQETNQIRPFPELVFLNCCFLGKIAPQKNKDLKLWNYRHRLAGNLAHQFIRNGAKAVVAAGWAVDDAAAETFATEFYAAMLSGNTFSQSVKSAREATFERHPACNTWGAYQCYGDPDYLLFEKTTGGTSHDLDILSVAEAAVELENLNERSSTASAKKIEESRQSIEKLLSMIERADNKWLQRSSIQEGLAKAYANADLFDKAIKAYEKAIAGSDAGSSLKAVEQLANLRAKQAVSRLKAGEGKMTLKARKQAAQGIRTAIRQLEELNTVIKSSSPGDVQTVERLSLIGSALKRLGAIETGAKRSATLGKAAKFYEDAYAIAIKPESGQTNAFYPALNALVLRGLQNLTGKQLPIGEKELDQIKAIRDNAELGDQGWPDFYSLAARTDALIAECIWRGTFVGRIEEIVASFKVAWKRGGSHLHRRAVLENLDFIADCLGGVRIASNESLLQSAQLIRSQIELASGD